MWSYKGNDGTKEDVVGVLLISAIQDLDILHSPKHIHANQAKRLEFNDW